MVLVSLWSPAFIGYVVSGYRRKAILLSSVDHLSTVVECFGAGEFEIRN